MNEPVDLTGVDAVPLKKTLLVVNNFVVTTVRFLNHFSVLCEEKLERACSDVARIERVLVLLESKLASIPGAAPGAAAAAPAAAAAAVSASAADAPPPPPAPAAEAVRLKDDPRVESWFKKRRLGLPLQAVLQLMAAAGSDVNPAVMELDPDMLVSEAEARLAGSGGIVRGGGGAPPPPAPRPPAAAAPPPPPAAAAGAGASSSTGVMKVREDPQFAKFFKLLGMGMPREGVEIKMRTEGLDPSVLDHPDDASPNANTLAPID